MNVREFMVTAGGLGYVRPAPGTWGSMPPVVLALGLVWTLGGPHWTIDASLVLCGIAFGLACVRFGPYAEGRYGRKDPNEVVADEVAGQCLTLLALPWSVVSDDGALLRNLVIAAIAFLSFRIADIIKPPPAWRIQQVPGGLGILADDLVAGLYAFAFMQVLVRALL